ncbi:MAG: hypothetical protein WCJ01_03530 [Ignavibacteria bacterium]
MNRIILAVTLIIVFAFASDIFAQPFPLGKGQILKHLKKELKLDDAQAEKIKGIVKVSDQKLKELRDKIETAREQEMEEMDKIISESDKQISKALNEDQNKKFEELKERRDECHQGMPPAFNGRGGGHMKGELPPRMGKCHETDRPQCKDIPEDSGLF